MRQAEIFVKDMKAGRLTEDADGYTFTYDTDYLAGENASPVSLTLPLTQKPYTSKTMLPFFDGLIPEGWLLATVHHNWKVDMRDRMGLLLLCCNDCIGDVSVREIKEE